MSRHQPHTDVTVATLDGMGAGDHDQPYHFGWRPSVSVPYPFNTRQYARLLVLRSCLHAEFAARNNMEGAAA